MHDTNIDRYRREEGRWRFAKRVVTYAYNSRRPASVTASTTPDAAGDPSYAATLRTRSIGNLRIESMTCNARSAMHAEVASYLPGYLGREVLDGYQFNNLLANPHINTEPLNASCRV
jgi:hypothetical protein